MMTGYPDDLVSFLKTQDEDKLFDLTEHKDKRSKRANGLLWECIGQLAVALMTDKWTVYLRMLKRYGAYEYICVKPKAVNTIRRLWREIEVVGELTINGQKAVELLCYHGSHTYNTQEFSHLLNGVISEMKEIGIPTPQEQELERAISEWEKHE